MDDRRLTLGSGTEPGLQAGSFRPHAGNWQNRRSEALSRRGLRGLDRSNEAQRHTGCDIGVTSAAPPVAPFSGSEAAVNRGLAGAADGAPGRGPYDRCVRSDNLEAVAPGASGRPATCRADPETPRSTPAMRTSCSPWRASSACGWLCDRRTTSVGAAALAALHRNRHSARHAAGKLLPATLSRLQAGRGRCHAPVCRAPWLPPLEVRAVDS